MSVEAISWALKQPVPKSSAKFVLVALANCARAEDGLAWPSIDYLAGATAQDRKTVITNLARLVGWKLIEDSEQRAGRTKQVVVYRLAMAPDLLETAPKTGQSQKRNSSISPPKESRFSAETVPKTGHGTVSNRNGTSERDARDVPRGTDAGHACRLMREAGCARTNPNHPDLVAAIAEGVTTDALADTAREAVESGKTAPFAWAIATARSRHREGPRALATVQSIRPQGPQSKTGQGIAALEALKHG